MLLGCMKNNEFQQVIEATNRGENRILVTINKELATAKRLGRHSDFEWAKVELYIIIEH